MLAWTLSGHAAARIHGRDGNNDHHALADQPRPHVDVAQDQPAYDAKRLPDWAGHAEAGFLYQLQKELHQQGFHKHRKRDALAGGHQAQRELGGRNPRVVRHQRHVQPGYGEAQGGPRPGKWCKLGSSALSAIYTPGTASNSRVSFNPFRAYSFFIDSWLKYRLGAAVHSSCCS